MAHYSSYYNGPSLFLRPLHFWPVIGILQEAVIPKLEAGGAGRSWRTMLQQQPGDHLSEVLGGIPLTPSLPPVTGA